MGKAFDGGISSDPLNNLMAGVNDLQASLHALTLQIVNEEHQSSLVDQALIDETPGKCADITAKRIVVEDLIGSTSSGLVQALKHCAAHVRALGTPLDELKSTYEEVSVESTGGPGHC